MTSVKARRVLVRFRAGPTWRCGSILDQGWDEHAAFIDDLVRLADRAGTRRSNGPRTTSRIDVTRYRHHSQTASTTRDGIAVRLGTGPDLAGRFQRVSERHRCLPRLIRLWTPQTLPKPW
jgi:hypothetical protein